MKACFGGPDRDKVLSACYSRMPDISIDYGIMEKTDRACVVPADMGWDDLGTWGSFAEHMGKDPVGNAVHGRHVGIDSAD